MGTKTYKILAVDDNADLLYSIVAGLEPELPNYKFTKAINGKDATKKIKSTKFDAVLLDIMMPDIDGWTVAATIKETSPSTKILFLTAKTDEMSKDMGSFTADDYIEKPVDLDDLKKRLQKVVENPKKK